MARSTRNERKEVSKGHEKKNNNNFASSRLAEGCTHETKQDMKLKAETYGVAVKETENNIDRRHIQENKPVCVMC